METIDFVLSWVDGNDSEWIAEKRKWEQLAGVARLEGNDANSDCRFRSDSDMLRYWFRAVEKFTPWFNKVFFVTCGQKPEWLDENHPKLKLVNHKDYIPSEYLPTFNSNVIELNYHRINDLSEHFVLFNDDVFFLQPVNEEYFFKVGRPVLDTGLKNNDVSKDDSNISRVMINNANLVNTSFDMKKSIVDNRRKWFFIKELGCIRTARNCLYYFMNKTLPAFDFGHLAVPHLKSTFAELWDRYNEIMDHSSRQKFRTDDQVNHWLMASWNQAKGFFYPANSKKRGRLFGICTGNVNEAAEIIRRQKYSQICLNDTGQNDDPEKCSRILINALDEILPDKSTFEKL